MFTLITEKKIPNRLEFHDKINQTDINIYIYIYRERERDQKHWSDRLCSI